MAEQPVQHIKTRKTPIHWDWWAENPVELILLVFILAAFFLMPRAGCGVTAMDGGATPAAQTPAGVEALAEPVEPAP